MWNHVEKQSESSNNTSPRIILLRTWLRNIGNGFIDHGARALLKHAFPTAEIIESSGYGNFVSTRLVKAGRHEQDVISDFAETNGSTVKQVPLGSQIRTVGDLVHADLAVLPGCILGKQGLGNYGPVLNILENRKTPVLLMGVGGSSYDLQTRDYVLSKLGKLNVIGIITRDPTAYETYKCADYQVHPGIDCAFFLGDAYNPPSADIEFIAATFDKVPEPVLPVGLPIIRPNHEPFGYARPFQGFAGTLLEWFKRTRRRYTKQNVFVSDLVEDYLFIYANANVTYSDRIHACVPAMVYGRKAQFFFKTPRAGLFSPFFGEQVWQEPCTLDTALLSTKKNEMISSLRSLMSSGSRSL